MTNSPRPCLVELPIVVRTYDIDFAGIVGNIVYIRWLEDLRLKLLEGYLPLEEQMQQNQIPVLVSTQIDYKRPVQIFDRVLARMWVSELARARWTLRAEFIANEALAALATQVGVFVDKSTMRPVAVPEDLRARFVRESGMSAGADRPASIE